MKVLDLFSGIGGFSLGLERAGMKTVAFCEIDPFCRKVLAKHWPDVPIHEDITKLRADHVGPVDLVCGGFPCQDLSYAGKGAGIDGSRSGLWSDMSRLVGELRPRYVVVENVAALLGRGLGRVLGDLAALGYDAEWHCIPASAVGAPHRRDRVWIIAYSDTQRCKNAEGRSRQTKQKGWQIITSKNIGFRHRKWPDKPKVGRVVHGLSANVGGVACLGNAVIPQVVELIGRAIMEREANA